MQARCHKLICPLGRAPLLGRCEPILSNIGSLFLRIPFYLEIIWPQANLETLNNESTIGEYVHWQFFQYIGLENISCGVSRSFVKVANEITSPAGYLVQYEIETTSNCQPNFIQQQASRVFGKMIKVNISGDVLVLLVHPGQWNEEDSTQMRRIYYYIGMASLSRSEIFVTLNAEMFCPKIELSISYVEIFSAAQEKEKRIFLSFFENADMKNDSDTIYVCQEHYFAVMSLTNACLCLKFMEAYYFAGFVVYSLF